MSSQICFRVKTKVKSLGKLCENRTKESSQTGSWSREEAAASFVYLSVGLYVCVRVCDCRMHHLARTLSDTNQTHLRCCVTNRCVLGHNKLLNDKMFTVGDFYVCWIGWKLQLPQLSGVFDSLSEQRQQHLWKCLKALRSTAGQTGGIDISGQMS